MVEEEMGTGGLHGGFFEITESLIELDVILKKNPENLTACLKKCILLERKADYSSAATTAFNGLHFNPHDRTLLTMYEKYLQQVRDDRPNHKAYQFEDLSLREGPSQSRSKAPPPWSKLSEDMELLLTNLNDIFIQHTDPEAERMRVRKALYDGIELHIRVLHCYYLNNLFLTVEQNAFGALLKQYPVTTNMTYLQLWRCMKESHIVCPLFVQSQLNKMIWQSMPKLTPVSLDPPYLPEKQIQWLEFFEIVLRCAWTKHTSVKSFSERILLCVQQDIGALGMKKQISDRVIVFKDWIQPALQESYHKYRVKLHKVYLYFQGCEGWNRYYAAPPAAAAGGKSPSSPPPGATASLPPSLTPAKEAGSIPTTRVVEELSINFNIFLEMFARIDAFDPSITPKKLRDIYSDVTRQDEILAQEHPNNNGTEMLYDEFFEAMVRLARIKAENKGVPLSQMLDVFLSDLFLPRVRKVLPGRL